MPDSLTTPPWGSPYTISSYPFARCSSIRTNTYSRDRRLTLRNSAVAAKSTDQYSSEDAILNSEVLLDGESRKGRRWGKPHPTAGGALRRSRSRRLPLSPERRFSRIRHVLHTNCPCLTEETTESVSPGEGPAIGLSSTLMCGGRSPAIRILVSAGSALRSRFEALPGLGRVSQVHIPHRESDDHRTYVEPKGGGLSADGSTSCSEHAPVPSQAASS